MDKNKFKFIPLLVAALVAGSIIFYLLNTKDTKKPAQVASSQTEQPRAERQETKQEFNKKRYSLESPDSKWVIVNKKRPLEASFVSRDLTPVGGVFMQAEAARQMGAMVEAAKKDQLSLKLISGYRSYSEQKSLYESYVRKDGQAAADTYSARAGFSEHQSGLAADLGNADGTCDLEICFEATPAGAWLVAHAHEYGFIVRYGKDKTALTGYQYEPWHVRYVGTDLAKELHDKGQTMEEFFGLPPSPGY